MRGGMEGLHANDPKQKENETTVCPVGCVIVSKG